MSDFKLLEFLNLPVQIPINYFPEMNMEESFHLLREDLINQLRPFSTRFDIDENQVQLYWYEMPPKFYNEKYDKKLHSLKIPVFDE